MSNSHLGNVSVEWDLGVGSSSLGNGKRNPEDGVGAELFFVGSSVEVQKDLVHSGLVGEVEILADEFGGDGVVDVTDGL